MINSSPRCSTNQAEQHAQRSRCTADVHAELASLRYQQSKHRRRTGGGTPLQNIVRATIQTTIEGLPQERKPVSVSAAESCINVRAGKEQGQAGDGEAQIGLSGERGPITNGACYCISPQLNFLISTSVPGVVLWIIFRSSSLI